MMQEEFEERTDPMAMVFPKVMFLLLTLTTMNHGGSGDVSKGEGG